MDSDESWMFHFGNNKIGKCCNCNSIIKHPNETGMLYSSYVSGFNRYNKNNGAHWWICNDLKCVRMNSTVYMYIDSCNNRCIGINNNGSQCTNKMYGTNKLCNKHSNQFIAYYNM
jgi:hypothetical protein